MNLLESAGFSKSNPYYIVPQGRVRFPIVAILELNSELIICTQITALTNAKDHERLALLKEVAGTKVYEQRRTESLRIMAETDAKRSKIDELLEYIENRLTELEDEKEELKEFQDKDKERRCLEYALYQRELEEVTEALEEIEEERRGEVHNANVRREQYNDREKQMQVRYSTHLSLLVCKPILRILNNPCPAYAQILPRPPSLAKAPKPSSLTSFALEPSSNVQSLISVLL